MATSSPLHFVIWKEGRHYVSQCLNVDVASFGSTREEALQNLREAMELYSEDHHSVEHEVLEEPEIISMPFQYA